MNVDGTLVDGVEPWFGKSIIRSCCKLDYGSAQKMLDGTITADNVDEWEEDRRPILGANPNITNATVIQSVKDLWSIGENRRAMRFETGAVSLNDVKLVFSLDAKGNPTRYGSYELKDSNRLVEEYMLLANYLVAQQLLRAHGPLAFLRHHPPPIGHTAFALVQAMLIKPMKGAEYSIAGNASSPASWHHYALNIPYYTHFTSPIRRYADVVVHRLLQESITSNDHRSDVPVNSSASEDLKTRLEELTSLAQSCSEKKEASKNAQKACTEVYLCAYLRQQGGAEVVDSMGQKSFTVYIVDIGSMRRLFLKDLNLRGRWNSKTSQLTICLPGDKVND
ncbi:unnamed protein product [Phytophthora lilii]|uniref:Unnamed protein product n=1 Tax=Phytophthora lilii TaxID=2077276 RepID=A0A9W6U1F0_9STRA|nr:unnamed protein product [Phytophthora lilii]